MNYDAVRREVIGSVDRHTRAVPEAPYVGCCSDTRTHVVRHGADCRCTQRGQRPVPDVAGRDIPVHVPQELAQVQNYAEGPAKNVESEQPPPAEVDRRISERIMWALENIDVSLNAIVEIFRDDAQK